MHLSPLLALPALFLVADATGQSLGLGNAARVPGPVKNAGIYHVESGTWTRTPGATSAFGPDVVYTNTAFSGYFNFDGGQGGGLGPTVVVDEGGLPGATNLNQPSANRDSYRIDGFQIGYCDLDPAPQTAGWDMSFYSGYTSCTDPTSYTKAAEFSFTGLPSGGCWVVTFDFEGTADEFCLEADGAPLSPGWDDDEGLDTFGWSLTYTGTGAGQAGWLLAGDPRSTDPGYLYTPPGPFPGNGGLTATAGTETYYGPASLCGAGSSSTGYLTQDRYRIDEMVAPFTSGCYYFGGYANINNCSGVVSRPFSSFYLEMYAQTSECDGGFGDEYCTSVPNSTGSNGQLSLIGSDTAADNDVDLVASSLPIASFGFFLTSQTQNLVMMPPGSVGTLCLGGNIGRFVAMGQIKNTGQAGEISLSTTAGEWSLMAVPTSTGPYAAMTGITTNFQAWHRDSVGGAAVSNFTNARSVTWL